jgi:hypothetical protein
MKLNPKVSTFLEEHPNKTLIGLGWSIYWRFFAVLVVIGAAMSIIGALL